MDEGGFKRLEAKDNTHLRVDGALNRRSNRRNTYSAVKDAFRQRKFEDGRFSELTAKMEASTSAPKRQLSGNTRRNESPPCLGGIF